MKATDDDDDDLQEMRREMLEAGADPRMLGENSQKEKPVSFSEALRNPAVRGAILSNVEMAVALSPSTREKVGVHLIGIALSVCGGAANAITFAKFKTYVSHVSGVSTAIGLRLEDQQPGDVPTPAEILLYFILGASLAGLLIPSTTMKMGHARYDVVLFLVAALELLCWWHELRYPEMLAAAMGLQNAMITSWSGAVLRTTHMTGTATDLGSSLGRIFSRFFRRGCHFTKYSDQDWDQHTVDQNKLLLMTCLLVAFVGGGWVGAAAYVSMKLHALLVPAGLSIILGAMHLVYSVVNWDALQMEQAAEVHFTRALSGGGSKTEGDRRVLEISRADDRTEELIRQLSGGSDEHNRMEQFIRQISGP